MATRWKQRLISALSVMAVNLAVVTGILYTFHRRYLGSLTATALCFPVRSASVHTGLPPELLVSLGFFGDSKVRDLRTLSPQHPGTIRIGAFGDSFTLGDEVDPGFDYPSLLAARFRRAGLRNVEVINFGSSWHGLGQSYRLYDSFARRYELDYVLLGPQTLFPDRDTTFNHTDDDRFPCYLHGRYVLEGDELRFIDVLGGFDAEARKQAYYSFIPSSRYLRYDRRPPAALRALLPSGGQLTNPFYYSSLTLEAETDRLYTALLSRFADDGQAVVFLHAEPWAAALGRRLQERLATAHLPLPEFPYRRRNAHMSAAGNALVAEAYFDVLTGQSDITLEQVQIHDTPVPSAPLAIPDLSHFTGLQVMLDAQPVAELMRLPHEFKMTDELIDLSGERIAGLVALKAPGQSMAGSYFLALRQELRPGAVVELAADLGGSWYRQRVEVRLRATSVGEVELEGIHPFTVKHPGLAFRGLSPTQLRRFRSGRLTVGGATFGVLQHAPNGEIMIVPEGGAFVAARPRADTFFEIGELPEKGALRILLTGAQPIHFDVGHFEKRRDIVRPSTHGRQHYLRPSASDPSRAERTSAQSSAR